MLFNVCWAESMPSLLSMQLGLGWMVASVDSHGGHSAHGHDQQHQDEEQGGGHGNGMANGGSRH